MSPEAFQDISHAPRFDKAGNAKPRMKVRTLHGAVCLMGRLNVTVQLCRMFQGANSKACCKGLKDILNLTAASCSVR